MLLDAPGRPLRLAEVADPEPMPGQLLVEVHACGVCRTDLHLLDGELEIPDSPRILGHQIVGTVAGSDRAGRIEGAAVIDLERAVDDPKGIRSLGPP